MRRIFNFLALCERLHWAEAVAYRSSWALYTSASFAVTTDPWTTSLVIKYHLWAHDDGMCWKLGIHANMTLYESVLWTRKNSDLRFIPLCELAINQFDTISWLYIMSYLNCPLWGKTPSSFSSYLNKRHTHTFVNPKLVPTFLPNLPTFWMISTQEQIWIFRDSEGVLADLSRL